MTRSDQKPRWESAPWVESSGTNSQASQPAAAGDYCGVVKPLPDIDTRKLLAN